MPRASVIIPHWNGKQHLDDCLNSLRAQTVDDFEVLLVDNGSSDGSQTYLREQFEWVELIELSENRGFTGACIAGWQQSSGDIVILLNNDTEVDEEWLSEVLRGFDQHPEVGIVASKMLLFDRRDTLHTAGDFVRVDGTPGNRGVWQGDAGQFEREEYVFSACGGSSAYRRSMLEEIGFLDDDFFFSCEDVDLGWRAQLAGWKTRYIPTAIVYHKLKASGGGVTASYYDGRNFFYLLWKNYPLSLLRKNWPVVLRGQWRITREALQHWRGEAARARLRGQLAGLFGVIKMLPKRRQIQASRRVSDDYLMSIMTPVDGE